MRFREEYWFLSNFYPTPVWGFPTAEHAFVSCKTIVPSERHALEGLKTPAQAKAFGRRCTMRPEWKDPKFRLGAMKAVVMAKFLGNAELRDKLVATGTLELVEENWWGDTFWGRCDGKGDNHLGKILMEVRENLTCKDCLKPFNPYEFDEDRWSTVCDECEAIREAGYVDANPDGTNEALAFERELYPD